ncbi:YkoP family protein [Halobacillus mangrovi]|uniref:YkoP-like domain-containing protein n=1 Tax=Halobacillus mangrovi TaxID=402384 RepID=A0A1W5ZSE6_9BACI|nr:hypothetical protein [Halobacillus mangrovi]ARI76203.1 hypothetical protein HM131_04850 [Halobacillus mangrovi]
MKHYIVYIWSLLDPFYFRLARLSYIHKNKNDLKNIFRVKLISYKGKPFICRDGTKVEENDKVLKIHLHNIRLIREMKHIKNDINQARYIFKAVHESLPELATYVYNHYDVAHIKGIIGVTALSRGSFRLGFEAVPISNLFYKGLKYTSFIMIRSMYRKPPSLADLRTHQPSYIYMSKEQLMDKYH